MIQLIVNAFVEKDKTGAVVEVLYASSDHYPSVWIGKEEFE